MRLADCFMPLLAAVRQFQRAPSGDAASLAAQLDRLSLAARNQARDAGFSSVDIDNGWFAALAWADEAILAANWNDASEWQRHLLQKRHFNTSRAGVEFFTRLEALSAEQLPVRELYYLCLAMGFAGRYGYDRNQKALEDIRRHNLELLLQGSDGLPGEAGRLLFPDGYASGTPHATTNARAAARWRPTALTLTVLLVPLLGLALLYGIYHVTIWQMVNALTSQLP